MKQTGGFRGIKRHKRIGPPGRSTGKKPDRAGLTPSGAKNGADIRARGAAPWKGGRREPCPIRLFDSCTVKKPFYPPERSRSAPFRVSDSERGRLPNKNEVFYRALRIRKIRGGGSIVRRKIYIGREKVCNGGVECGWVCGLPGDPQDVEFVLDVGNLRDVLIVLGVVVNPLLEGRPLSG